MFGQNRQFADDMGQFPVAYGIERKGDFTISSFFALNDVFVIVGKAGMGCL